MLRGKNAGKAVVNIGILLFAALYISYLLNVYEERQIGTGKIQFLIIAVSMITFVFYCKIDQMVLLTFGLSLSMFVAVALTPTGVASIARLFSKIFLWFFVFILGYNTKISTSKGFGSKNILYITFIIVCFNFFENSFSDFSNTKKNLVQTSIYYVICFLPMVLCIQNKKLKVFAFAMVCLFTVLSLKRSAILVVAAVCLGLGVMHRKQLHWDRILKTILGGGVIAILILLVYSKIKNVDFSSFFDVLNAWEVRFHSESSRDSLFMSTLNMQLESDLFSWIFGHGYDAVRLSSPYQLSSHCDYIEILYNYGLVSFVLFIIYISWLLYRTVAFYKWNCPVKDGYLAGVVILVISCIPSHLFTYSTYFLMLAYFFGYSENLFLLYRNKHLNRRKKEV